MSKSPILEARKSLGLTQKEFAGPLGITKNYCSLLENNHRVPSLGLLRKIEEVYGLNLTITFKDREDKIEEIRKAFEDRFRDVKLADGVETLSVVDSGGNLVGKKEIWNFFLPHLKTEQEIREQAVREFGEYFEGTKFDMADVEMWLEKGIK